MATNMDTIIPDRTVSSSSTASSCNNENGSQFCNSSDWEHKKETEETATAPGEVKHEDIRPCSVSSSSSSSMASPIASLSSTHHTDSSNSNEREKNSTAPTPTPTATPAPVAFVEKEFLVKRKGETREARTAPLLPETNTSGDASTRSASTHAQQPTTTTNIDNDNNSNSSSINNNNDDGVIIKNEDSLANDDDTPIKKINNEKKRKQRSTTSIKSEEGIDNNDDDACPYMGTRSSSSRRKQKQFPSESGGDFINPNDSLNANTNKKKRKRNNNQRGGGGCAVVSNNAQSSTLFDNNDCSTDNERNCSCRFCNNPLWENKIFYNCGTLLSKYFPKSDNNPNPGWYNGTVKMHYYVSTKEEEEEGECVWNEIHYDDGDIENMTQDELKLLLTDHQVRILSPTKSAGRSSNIAPPDPVACAMPDAAATAGVIIMDQKCTHDKKWLENYEKLEKFKAENGHCRVPNKYFLDPSLGRWVRTQRSRYIKDNPPMAADRVEKLNEIGFDWILREQHLPTTILWRDAYHRLEKFKKENGHCRVPSSYSEDPFLSKERLT